VAFAGARLHDGRGLLAVDGDPLAEPSRRRDPARVVLVAQDGRVVADRRGA